jgi:phage tail sheath protein FI
VWEDAGTQVAYRAAAGFLRASDNSAVVPPATVEVATVDFLGVDADGSVQVEEDLGYHPTHARYIGSVLALEPTARSAQLANIFALEIAPAATIAELRTSVATAAGGVTLGGGSDGALPVAANYTPALADLEALDDISTVAAPGHTEYDENGIRTELVTHVERRGLYRVAILESTRGDTVSQVRDARATVDSKYAAMYYPWVVVSNPRATAANANEPKELLVPPSGFVAGIFARSDNDHGVWKSPANEVVQGALRFERSVSFGESELLNPLGVNCLRYFPGRGQRVWGARTISSDPEWKYLSVRRYFNYLEASIERGTQWAVFESNGPALWANVTQTIDSFLYGEWRNGALLGSTPKEAYFVRCDLTTMTQADLDNGRMICLIGVAVVKPAEFVIFRIGQKTATARN